MILTMDRFSYAPTETEGLLHVEGYEFPTMERPWIPWKNPGGKPFESCVPDGEYSLEPFVRERDGSAVYALVNHSLGVYRDQGTMKMNPGRYSCLIHAANFVFQVVGCIAPGLKRGILRNNANGSNERAVLSSGEAMRIIKSILDPLGEEHMLVIKPRLGAGGTV